MPNSLDGKYRCTHSTSCPQASSGTPARNVVGFAPHR